MLVETISSRQNPLVKRLVAVREGRERRFLFLEGARLIQDALRSGVHFEAVAYSQKLLENERGRELFELLKNEHCRGAFLTDALMGTVSDLETPPGIVALGGRPFYELEVVTEAPDPFLVLADGLQDPGNMGALVRTAEAAGVTGFIAARGSVDPFQMKALRGSAGAALRVPIVTGVTGREVLAECRRKGIRIVAADSEAAEDFSVFDWTGPTVLWLGSEAEGVADRAGEADAVVAIPMAGMVESLNITVAASLLLYEAARRRDVFTATT